MLNRLGAFSLPFLALQLTRETHSPLSTVGLVLAGFGLASMVSRLVGGRLADTWGRRQTMVAGLVGCALAQLAIAASRSLAEATVSVIALGLAFEVYEPPCQALLADGVDPNRRAAAFGLLGASLSLAALGAGLIAAVLAPVSLRLLFVADAVSCLTAALLAQELLPGELPSQLRRGAHHEAAKPWRSPHLMFLFCANVVFAAAYLQVGVSLPLTMQHRGVSASGYGVVLVTFAAVVIAAQPVLRVRQHSVLDRSSSEHAAPVIVGCLLLAVALAGYGQAHSLTAFVAATVVGGVGEVLLGGHVLAMVSALAPSAVRGRYLAVFGLSWGFAATLGPIPATLLLEHAGDRTLWTAAAGCCAAVAVGHTVAWRTPWRTCETPGQL
jgi:MFS family permease